MKAIMITALNSGEKNKTLLELRRWIKNTETFGQVYARTNKYSNYIFVTFMDDQDYTFWAIKSTYNYTTKWR